MPAAAKAAIFRSFFQRALHTPAAGTHTRRSACGNSLARQRPAGNQPFLRLSRPVSKTAPGFPRPPPPSPRRKRSINPDLLSLSLGYSLSKPRSSVSRERCTNIWFNKTVPRSLALALSPDRPSFLRIALLDIRPDLRSKADPVAAPPHASLPESLLLAGASDESVADIGLLLPIPPPWPQVLFSFRPTRHRSCHIQTTRRHYRQHVSPAPSNTSN